MYDLGEDGFCMQYNLFRHRCVLPHIRSSVGEYALIPAIGLQKIETITMEQSSICHNFRISSIDVPQNRLGMTFHGLSTVVDCVSLRFCIRSLCVRLRKRMAFSSVLTIDL